MRGIVQAAQGALLCDRETGVLTVETKGVAKKARGAGGEGIPDGEESGVVDHHGVFSIL
ncbi:hypothetical protein KDH_27170 [Dictyobacter sp. S3.2.2.5]|uniref:Uncharacterized protein n=1 Tax=Dictyobacter halimunensis TaxID=3026934 RepID=A0ABQ6FNM5_9CHLR|nr:hypothetical protein KDH_27170 [Dictyobacter sp. S3.2.2.5]